MKVEVSLFAGLLVIATTLLARAQIQGLEGALLSMAVEYSFRGVRAGSRILHSMVALDWLSASDRRRLSVTGRLAMLDKNEIFMSRPKFALNGLPWIARRSRERSARRSFGRGC